MRHRRAGVKLNRTSSHRNAMFRNMVTSLFKHERIRTTEAKAKELRRWADHLVTLAKRGDLHARRQVMAIIREKQVVHKLFEEAQGRFGSVNGGYTRVVKLGYRPGDAAPLSMVELVTPEVQKKKKRKRKKAKATAETAPPVEKKTEDPTTESPDEEVQAAKAPPDEDVSAPPESEASVSETEAASGTDAATDLPPETEAVKEAAETVETVETAPETETASEADAAADVPPETATEKDAPEPEPEEAQDKKTK